MSGLYEKATSSRRRLSLVCLFANLLALASLALAQQAPDKYPNTVRLAQQFLQNIYPELRGQHASLTVKAYAAFDSEWTWMPEIEYQVTDLSPFFDQPVFDGRAQKPVQIKAKTLLGGMFLFAPDGRLNMYVANSVIAHSAENDRIREFAQSHPEWSDAQAIRALKNAGARYGPDDRQEFERALPIAALQKCLGKITVKAVEFKALDQNRNGSFVWLSWTVTVEAQKAEMRDTYVLGFEPFQGKLVSLSRTSAFGRPTGFAEQGQSPARPLKQ